MDSVSFLNDPPHVYQCDSGRSSLRGTNRFPRRVTENKRTLRTLRAPLHPPRCITGKRRDVRASAAHSARLPWLIGAWIKLLCGRLVLICGRAVLTVSIPLCTEAISTKPLQDSARKKGLIFLWNRPLFKYTQKCFWTHPGQKTIRVLAWSVVRTFVNTYRISPHSFILLIIQL